MAPPLLNCIMTVALDACTHILGFFAVSFSTLYSTVVSLFNVIFHCRHLNPNIYVLSIFKLLLRCIPTKRCCHPLDHATMGIHTPPYVGLREPTPNTPFIYILLLLLTFKFMFDHSSYLKYYFKYIKL
jgi:vacuolar-type H+-ATPase subunit I/STV1